MTTPLQQGFAAFESLRDLADAQRAHVIERLGEDSAEQLGRLLDYLAPSSLDGRPAAELGWTTAQADGYDGYQAYTYEIALQNCPLTPALEMLYLAPRLHVLLQRGLKTSDFDEFEQVRSRVLQLLEHDPWLADPRLSFTCGPQEMSSRDKPLLACGVLAPGLQVIDDRDLPIGDAELLSESLVRHDVIRRALAADALLGGWHNGLDVRSNSLTPEAMLFVVTHCELEFLPQAMELDPDTCHARLDAVLSQAIQVGDDGQVGRVLLQRIADGVAAGAIARDDASSLVTLTTLRAAFEDFYSRGDDSDESFESFHQAVELICRVRLNDESRDSGDSQDVADCVAGLPKARYWGLLIDVAGTDADPYGDIRRTLMEDGSADFWAACMDRLLTDGLVADSLVEVPIDRSTTQRTTVLRAIQEGPGDTAAAIFQSLVTYRAMGERIASGTAAEPAGPDQRPARRARII